MKRIGLILFGIGLTGFLIGGAGLDGPTSTASAILTAISFLAAVAAYRLWVKVEQREAYEEAQEERRKEEIEAAKQIDTRPKEATFRVWLTSCKLDVPL
ncbi:MAG: hypothetical protein Q4C77_16255 [Eubacteriales bacterium]|nr:hypothetical protein [Eubacteriales bacterium]